VPGAACRSSRRASDGELQAPVPGLCTHESESRYVAATPPPLPIKPKVSPLIRDSVFAWPEPRQPLVRINPFHASCPRRSGGSVN
jgi:hypothetical protein